MSATLYSPGGQTIGADGDSIYLYYGAADSCMALGDGQRTLFTRMVDAHSASGSI